MSCVTSPFKKDLGLSLFAFVVIAMASVRLISWLISLPPAFYVGIGLATGLLILYACVPLARLFSRFSRGSENALLGWCTSFSATLTFASWALGIWAQPADTGSGAHILTFGCAVVFGILVALLLSAYSTEQQR